jgi:threonine dehydrogenase-like Zn-dependent dehydrogenase
LAQLAPTPGDHNGSLAFEENHHPLAHDAVAMRRLRRKTVSILYRFRESIMTVQFAVAGLGYVGLSNAVLLAQKYPVVACDISPERVALLGNRTSPISDPELEDYLATKDLKLTATNDTQSAYRDATHVIVATPTNYDPQTNAFDTSSVEAVISEVAEVNDQALIIIKSTIPVGLVSALRKQFGIDRIIHSPEFLREGGRFMTICTPRGSWLANVPNAPKTSQPCSLIARSRTTFQHC